MILIIIILAVITIIVAVMAGIDFSKKDRLGGYLLLFLSIFILISNLKLTNEYKKGTPAMESYLKINEIYETISSTPYQDKNIVILLNRDNEVRAYIVETQLPKIFKVIKNGEYKQYPSP